ncbi:MAG: four helix bundle protein [Bacteroidetes bacterium]|nr:MAG: four helix bundle protein [Bacteroidota bacterium]
MRIERFEDFEIWKDARSFSVRIFELTKKKSFHGDFKFQSQLRSSSGSIMDNIAEGFERGGRKEFIQFLSIAKGSSGEAKSQIYRAFDYQYINQEEFNEVYEKAELLGKKIGSLMQYLKRTPYSGTKFKEP